MSCYCTNCGTEIKDGSKFCPACGALAPDPRLYQADQNAQPNTQYQVNPNTQPNTQYQANQPVQQGAPRGDNSHVFGIVAYITWIGWLVALLARDKNDEFVRFHVNQALVIWLFSLLCFIPLLGWIWGIFIFICWLLGLISACKYEMKPVPLIGSIQIIKS